MTKYPRERIKEKDFLNLLEYSTSIPTGATIGKRWRRHHQWKDKDGSIKSTWYIGEYVQDADPKMVGIKWTRPLIEKDDGFIY